MDKCVGNWNGWIECFCSCWKILVVCRYNIGFLLPIMGIINCYGLLINLFGPNVGNLQFTWQNCELQLKMSTQLFFVSLMLLPFY